MFRNSLIPSPIISLKAVFKPALSIPRMVQDRKRFDVTCVMKWFLANTSFCDSMTRTVKKALPAILHARAGKKTICLEETSA